MSVPEYETAFLIELPPGNWRKEEGEEREEDASGSGEEDR